MKIFLFDSQLFKNIEMDENMRTDDTMRTKRLCRRLIKLVKMVICHSFIAPNISYCPLARH